MKVSFCVICQDEEEMIKQCVQFLAKVSAHVDGDTEFIFVDGGSKDNTIDILHHYESFYPNFKVYCNPWPGFAAQLNYALDKAKGEWVFSMAADEVLSDNIFQYINVLINLVGPKAYSFQQVHLYKDTEHMIDGTMSPGCRLKRNSHLFRWKDIAGLEDLFYEDKIVIQHPSHFNFSWQVYVPKVQLVHFHHLKSLSSTFNNIVKRIHLKRSAFYGKSEDDVNKWLNKFNPKICHIDKYHKGLKFYTTRGANGIILGQ